ncbi:MAG: hypothetical protein GF411_08525 [Candidatus Lokiarchaeota archaeon]|nr:hypothetical protein [Candidatus Lokiarchaeota archaeon]
MGYFYFYKEENIRSLTHKEITEIEIGVANLANRNLPWEFVSDLYGLQFCEDKGMNLDNGVMGATKFFSNRIMLSPDIVKQLCWKSVSGVPNNEVAISIIIHELTHRRQMKWMRGLAWPILNIPVLSSLTIERWARQNEKAAVDILSQIYYDIDMDIALPLAHE